MKSNVNESGAHEIASTRHTVLRGLKNESSRSTVSVIIPTLNEAGNLPYVLDTIPDWVTEVIVVDGRSTDDTERVARLLHPSVKIVHELTAGKGAALKAGLAASSGDYLICLDADGSMDGRRIGAFRDALDNGAQYVKGSRFAPGGGSADITRFRRLGDRGICFLMRLLFGARYSDASYGYFAVRADCVEYLRIDTNGFETEILMNIRAFRSRLKIAEVPCFEGRRIHGSSSLSAFRDGLRIAGFLIREKVQGHRGPSFDRKFRPVAPLVPAKPSAVVAGPSSMVNVPGLMTGEVVQALSAFAGVTEVAINCDQNSDSGLERARSLSANFRFPGDAPRMTPQKISDECVRKNFRKYFADRVELAVAVVWPGIDHSWLQEFIGVARRAGSRTVVLVVDHPGEGDDAASFAREAADADLVLLGDSENAARLRAALEDERPVVETHVAMSLTGRLLDDGRKRLTTFLPKDDQQALLSVLRAFDATPADWINDYRMRVIMRYTGRSAPDRVAASYHASHVELVGEEFSSLDLHRIATESSAMSVADPAIDSRAFATAMEVGLATVVLAGDMATAVGRGYVGGLLADVKSPSSIYIAHNQALRLADLRFPKPDAWCTLASRLRTEMWPYDIDHSEKVSSRHS